MHFPEDFDLDDVTSGYPTPSGSITGCEVEALYKSEAPYAQLVLNMGDLLPHQHTIDAPGDEPAIERDYLSTLPFQSAIKNRLTSYPVNLYKVDLKECTLEISGGSMRSLEEGDKSGSQEKTDSPVDIGSPGATSSPLESVDDRSAADGSVRSTGSDSWE